jgi:Uma2 family endonuclease
METVLELELEEDLELVETEHELSDYERERGKPMPSLNHSIAQSNLIGCLLRFKKQYRTASELSLNLPTLRATPDICLYPQRGADFRHDQTMVSEPPVVAIEIVSHSQSTSTMLEKFDQYFANGVKSCWLVQPSLEAITVVHPGAKPRTFDAGTLEDTVAGISIQVEEVFE